MSLMVNKRITKDPITKHYHCTQCFKGFSSSANRRRHHLKFCKMSGKKASPSADRTPTGLLKKMIEDYSAMKKEGLTEDQIKSVICRSIDMIQVNSIRAVIEKQMQEDSEKLQLLSEAVKRNLKEAWAYKERIAVPADEPYEEAEIRALNSINQYDKIEDLLAKHRTACSVLERNAIRLCPYTEHRLKVYEILNSMMPTQIKRTPSDII